ncbi:MAG: transcriptional repressor NrdR [Planctomycetes bacterium]|nr:transcriptional repressor NrdR [Planctomycetota bacterium]
MRCPYCKSDDDRVVDSRASADGFAIRRRRLCRECGRRYTTYERVEGTTLRVVKKSGERVEFDRAKIVAGLLRACEKRPITTEQVERIADSVERQCTEAFDKEVPTKVIGELIMEQLRRIDQVAYVRFASVYREFKDVGQFLDELQTMLSSGQLRETRDAPGNEAGERAARSGGPRGADGAVANGKRSSPAAGDGRRGIHEDTQRVPDLET